MARLAVKHGTILSLAALLVFAGGCLELHRHGTKGAEAAVRHNHAKQPASPPPTTTNPTTSTESTTASGNGLLFHEGFEAGKIGPGWTGFAMHPETSPPEKSDSIKIVTDPVRAGKYALEIIVQPDDAVTDGDRRIGKERCELLRINRCRNGSCTFGDEGREGSEIWYAWSVLIPNDYQYLSTNAKNYQIMGQWHDQPDPGRKPTGYSPPISVHYESTGGSAGFRIKYGRIQAGDVIKSYYTPIQKGKWVDLIFHIRFSQGSDGFLEAWKDGVQLSSESGVTRITGPNMYNSEPNYLRLGLYRGKAQTQTNTFYYDEIKIATSKPALLGE